MRRVLMLLCLAAVSGCATQPKSTFSVEPKKAATLNADLGLRYMIDGKYDLAMDKLKRALSYEPDSLEAHHYLAELYRRLGRAKEADKNYRAALSAVPSDEPASALHNNYGAFLCEQHRVAEGEKQFLKVLDNPVYPQRAQTYENLGLCLMEVPDRVRAEKYFRQALAIDGRLPSSLYNMAQISFAEKKYRSTRAFLQRYEAVALPTPATLWLGIRTERILGNRDAVASYGLLLKNRFADSREAKLYLESQRSE